MKDDYGTKKRSLMKNVIEPIGRNGTQRKIHGQLHGSGTGYRGEVFCACFIQSTIPDAQHRAALPYSTHHHYARKHKGISYFQRVDAPYCWSSRKPHYSSNSQNPYSSRQKIMAIHPRLYWFPNLQCGFTVRLLLSQTETPAMSW